MSKPGQTSKNKKLKVAKKPTTADTYKYNAIGNKPWKQSQVIQSLKSKKSKTKKVRGLTNW